MRPVFVLSLIAVVSATSFAQDPDKKISFLARATTAKNVLEGLSKVAGVTLKTVPSTENDNLIIDVVDVPLGQLMAKISTTLEAEWVKNSDGTISLVRSDKASRDQYASSVKLWSTAFKVELDKLAAEIQKKGSYDAARAKLEAERAVSQEKRFSDQISEQMRSGNLIVLNEDPQSAPVFPAQWTIHRLLVALGPDALANVLPGRRSVFALTPNRMQSRLPASATAILNDFMKASGAFERARANVPKETSPDMHFVFGENQNNATSSKGIGEAIFAITRQSPSSVSVSLTLVDVDGKLLGTGNHSINAQLPKEAQPPIDVERGASQIAFSEDALTHSKLLLNSPNVEGGNMVVRSNRGMAEVSVMMTSGGPSSSPAMKASESWRQKLMDPATYDPLSFAASDATLGLAKSVDSNLVASLPDSAIMSFATMSGTPQTPSALMTAMQTSIGLSVIKDGPWLTIKPRDAYSARMARLNRRAAALALRSIPTNGGLKVGVSTELALSMNLGYRVTGLAEMTGHIDPQAKVAINDLIFNLPMYQLYGTLTPAQRQGNKVAYGSLSPRSKGIVDFLTYNDNSGFSVAGRALSAPGQSRETRTITSNGTTFSTDNFVLQSERTEAMPNGTPLDTEITLEYSNEDAVQPMTGPGAYGRIMTGTELGMSLAMAESTMSMTTSGSGPRFAGIEAPKYENFRVASLSRLTMTLQWLPTLSKSSMLEEATSSGSPMTLDRLPRSLQDQIEQGKTRMRTPAGPPPFAR